MPDFPAMNLLPNLLAGGAGGISGLNNIVPELFVDAMQSWRTSDLVAQTEIQQKTGRLRVICSISDDLITTIKTAVSLRSGSMATLSSNAGGQLSTAEQNAVEALLP